MNKVRAIAFYLPQFHPTPENNEWWGPGFTEWTNVAKAKPLYKGHIQPQLPSELGFYDLRIPEVREHQAVLAREYGIEAFCYWHYWFGNGRRLLERPFNEVLASGKPDFPFCLAWANETWEGRWHGADGRVLIEQQYPGDQDYQAHFEALLPAFRDSRYLRVNDKPFFLVYHPADLPDPRRFTDLWRKLAAEAGLKGLTILGMSVKAWDPVQAGFDGSIEASPANLIKPYRAAVMREFQGRFLNRVWQRVAGRDFPFYAHPFSGHPLQYDYRKMIDLYPATSCPEDVYPSVVSNWDNTPRSGRNGVVLTESHPLEYRRLLEKAAQRVISRPPEKRMIFIRSWNEWAEGNYIEPDARYGRAYLEATRDVVCRTDG